MYNFNVIYISLLFYIIIYLLYLYFRHRLTIILSGMYALFIITLGLAVYVTDIVDGSGPIAEVIYKSFKIKLHVKSKVIFRRTAYIW